MKIIKSSLIAFLIILISACSIPLEMETDGRKLAEIIGIDYSSVKFISYCDFDEIRNWEEKIVVKKGIVVLTVNELIIFNGNLNSMTKNKEIVVSIDKIDGVGVEKYFRARQVQVAHGEHLVIVQVAPDQVFISQRATEELFQALVSYGVPPSKCVKYYFP